MADPVIGKLTINFRGICTHFWGGIVPGIQHRVVLVDAAQIRPVVIVANGVPMGDWLMPHIPTIQSDDSQLMFNAQPMLQGGLFTMGSRLTVPNGIADPNDPNANEGRVNYKNFTTGVQQVAGFTDNYAFSSDVVVAGRAALYLDLFNGTVEASVPGPNVVVTVTATVYTDGAPRILVSPFLIDPENDIPDQLLELPIGGSPSQPEASVTLSNSCLLSPDSGNPQDTQTNDYLLHLLTNRGGIPRFVSPPVNTPVAPPHSSPEAGLKNLRTLGFPLRLDPPSGGGGVGPPSGGGGLGTTESCSDSRYP